MSEKSLKLCDGWWNNNSSKCFESTVNSVSSPHIPFMVAFIYLCGKFAPHHLLFFREFSQAFSGSSLHNSGWDKMKIFASFPIPRHRHPLRLESSQFLRVASNVDDFSFLFFLFLFVFIPYYLSKTNKLKIEFRWEWGWERKKSVQGGGRRKIKWMETGNSKKK